MIYDAFPFLNELELLEIRLATLAPHVDRFVLVEANQTHSTLTRKHGFLFEEHKDAFRDWLDKIIYVKLDNEFFTVEQLKRRGWPTRLHHRVRPTLLANGNENFQRDCLVRALASASPDDVVLISDVDEIINPDCLPEAMALLRTHRVVALQQVMFRYFLNNRELDFVWTLPRATTCREALATKPHVIRGLTRVPVVKNGGWHFSSVGGMERLMYKMESFLHHDRCYSGRYKDPEEMKRLFEERVLRQRKDVFHFLPSRFEFAEIDESLPRVIRENPERYRELMYRADP